MDELLGEPDEEKPWIVENLLPAGGLSLLVAKPKVGKSTTARSLAVSVALGESFLGRACAASPVIYLALEDKRQEIRDHFRAMRASGCNILVHVGAAPVNVKTAIEGLYTLIEEHRPGLIIIDTLLRFLRLKDANDYAMVTNALDPILNLSRLTACHIMALHHAPKSERSDADNCLGSTAFFGTVDTMFLMSRTSVGRTLKSTQRYGKDLPETHLEMDSETRRISAFSVDGLVAKAARRPETTILELLQDKPLSETAIRSLVKGDNRRIAAVLQQMVKEGRVQRTPKPGRGGGCLYSLPACPLGSSEKRETESDLPTDAKVENQQ
ncbi:MAG: AAA family ATPase [Planctomycetota bacterium]|nr:AAA family ATPase [Planctomycetota bacterium]